MSLGVADAAARLGVSQQRIRQLIAEGSLAGKRVSGRWVIEEQSLRRPRSGSRPLSRRMAWAVIGQLSDAPVQDLYPAERIRVDRHVARLASADPSNRLLLLDSMLVRRADVRAFSCAPADLADLRADSRLHLSGYSAPEANLAGASDVEGYVLNEDIDSLRKDFLLVDSDRPNVWLHLVDAPHDWAVVQKVLVAADLASHGGPREEQRALELLREVLA